MAQQLGELVVLPSDQVHFLAPTWHGDSQLSVTRVPGNLKLSLASMGTKHVHGAQTYLQANTHPHKIVRIFLLIKKKRIASQAILTGMFLSELPECAVYTAGTISHVSGYQRTAWKFHKNGSCRGPLFFLSRWLSSSSVLMEETVFLFLYGHHSLWIRTLS